MNYQLLADTVLALHFAIVVFVVGGLLLIVAGNLRHWHWVNRPWFRVLHLLAIAVVVLQAWLGRICPLTVLESWLRRQAGGPGYEASFIEHWLQSLIYFDAPLWFFALLYSGFGLLVVVAWWRFPPQWKSRTGVCPPGRRNVSNSSR